MSLELHTFAPDVSDSIIPRWLTRMNGLGMYCEIHPEFSFATHSGFLPFKLRLEDSAHQQLNGVDWLTGFELYVEEFSLEKEIESLSPKPGLLQKLLGKRPAQIDFASPEIDQKLKLCKKRLRFTWGSADTFELRMASVSAATIAEITSGVCTYPADNIWYDTESVVENAIKEAKEYENSLKPKEIKLHKFEEWL